MSETTTSTESKAQAPVKSNTEETKLDPKTVAKQEKRVAQEAACDSAKHDLAQTLESNGHYNDLGFVYAAGSPVANSVGLELGVFTKDDKTGGISRSGIGFYLRSDHACNIQFTDNKTVI